MSIRTEIKEEIDLCPMTINKAWQGRRYRTRDYKKWTDDALSLLPKRKMITGQVAVFLRFYLSLASRTDIDNLIKPCLDVIVKKKYIEDDRFVYFLQAQKVNDPKSKVEFDIIKMYNRLWTLGG